MAPSPAPTAWQERRPPAWFGRALLLTVLAVVAAILAWRALAMLGTVATIVVVSWFLALAINSRIVLAAVSTAATFVVLTVLRVPYALPLAAFTGVVSQFVPTVGAYIGGALPVAVALTVSPVRALVVLGFVIAYQQVENLVLAPKISARSLQLNPAVAFLAVLAFGAVFGALGAFLALPVAATIQAVSTVYLRRHELVDSELLREQRAPGDERPEGDETQERAHADEN